MEARITELENALNISPDDVGRIMHESWSKTKRTQGFHGPNEPCTAAAMTARFYCDNCRFDEISKTWSARCQRFHPDLVPWDELPEAQKDINRRAFDAVIEEIRRRANREAARKVMGGGAQNLP